MMKFTSLAACLLVMVGIFCHFTAAAPTKAAVCQHPDPVEREKCYVSICKKLIYQNIKKKCNSMMFEFLCLFICWQATEKRIARTQAIVHQTELDMMSAGLLRAWTKSAKCS